MTNLRWLSLFFITILFSPMGLLAEGTQTGVVTGVVLDPSDQPLPRVMVSLLGAQGKAEAVTDSEGRFRFPALGIGVYEAAAELLGLQGARAEVRVFIDRTTETTLRLGKALDPGEAGELGDLGEDSKAASPGQASDTIQVVAVAPLLDRFETRVEASVSREFLERLPVERFYQSFALVLPTVSGGSDGNPNVAGSRRSNNLYLVDGVDTTDPTTGLFGLNLSFEAVTEVAITLAAPPVELGRASGAPINVVTRSGGQNFSGSGRWLLSGGGLRKDFRDPEPILAPELAAANSQDTNLNNTVAATFSGPLLPDHLWFFAALERGESQLLRPTLEGTQWDDGARLNTNLLKLSARLSSAHSLVGQFTSDESSFTSFSAFDRSPAENRVGSSPRQLSDTFFDRLPGDIFSLQDSTQEGDFSRLSWDWVAKQNLTVSAAAASQSRELERLPQNSRGITGGAPHLADNPFVDFNADFVPGEQLSAIFNGITDQGQEQRDRDQANLAITTYLQGARTDHELGFGFDFQRTESTTRLNFAGPTGIDPFTGVPTRGRLFFDTDNRDECVFDGFCLAFDPMTGEFQPDFVINSWERQPTGTEVETLSVYLSESLSWGRWLLTLGARYESVRGTGEGLDIVEDDSFAPRIGIKLDPKNDGRTLLSATFGRFFESFPQSFVDSFVNPDAFSGNSSYFWLGALGEDCFGQDPSDLRSPCWEFSDSTPLLPFQPAEPNLDLERSSVDEITVGIEHQLSANTDLRITYVDREWNDLWDDLFEFLEDGSTEFRIENLPEAERSYEGLSLLVQKRFADRWQLLGSYTWSRAEGNLFSTTGRATFADFRSMTDLNLVNRYGRAPFDRTHQMKLFSQYRFSLGRADLTLGTALRFEDGAPIQQESQEDLGIRFVTRRGSQELEELYQIDLSLNFEIATARGLQILSKLEVFNLTDENTRLGAETDLDSGVFGSPRSLADLQRPQSLRLTFGFRF